MLAMFQCCSLVYNVLSFSLCPILHATWAPKVALLVFYKKPVYKKLDPPGPKNFTSESSGSLSVWHSQTSEKSEYL